ncbi:MAG: ankyrin repeat domain-containing protein, partial [Phycisphaerales bacterium]|nr:ankyrin repeat domain-containing protein [Phycisphaerales bacterium]
CTSAKLAPNTVLKPGEETPMEVKLKGGTRAAVLTKTCRLIVQDQQPVIMQVRGNAISFVSATPGDLDPNVHTDGRLVFSSADGEPFRITSMNPNIITDFPKEPSATVTINFPYDAWRDGGAQPKVIFYTDHPKCEMVYVGIRRTAADIEKIRQKQREQQRQIGEPVRGVDGNKVDTAAPPPNPAAQLEARIRRGDTEALLSEVASGAIGLEAVNQSGMTLLAMASKFGQTDLMHGLIDAGANIEAPNRNGHTPLMQAAQSKNVEAVRVLLDAGARVDTRDKLNGTAMSMAATYGNPAIVQELIDAGGRVNEVQDLTGFTPLIWASIAGDPEVVPLLIEAGADIEHGDLLEGATPLIHAARTGKIDTVKYLIEAGADVNARDRNGKTPFLSAVNGAASTAAKL